MFNKYKKIIIAALVIFLLFIGYVLFLKPDETGSSFLRSSASDSPHDSTQALGADIMRAINQIDSLELDESIFRNPVLMSLIDDSEEIDSEPVGRNNPFAPLGASNLIVDEDQEEESTE